MKQIVHPALRIFSGLSFLFLVLHSFAATLAQTAPPSTQKPVLIPAPNSTPVISTGNLSEDDSYRVGPGDVLEVRVFGRPELGREGRISNLGTIRLPFLEEIRVVCKTEAELAQLITEKYKKYLREPQVDVFIKEYKSQPVAVIGSVAAPGRFQLQRRVRLLELLTFAGGHNLNAGGTVHIIRGSAPDFCEMSETAAGATAKIPTPAIVPVDSPPAISKTPSQNQNSPTHASAALPDQAALQASVAQGQGILLTFKLPEVLLGNPEFNPYIRPGDIISVPETDQIYVIGQVVKPGAIPMRQKITLLQAIGMAGGFMVDASKGKVKVARQEPGTNARKEFVYDVNDIQKKKAEDITLMPNDVVDVPASITKSATRGLVGVGLGMVGYLPYWIIR
ncbi:MAG: polysaccharide biosynthesis/export family protein [Acidobacteria bacterium]|nr:polysaccharide biosynthesis/export family protein [Acidobacteriota bacterium]